MRALRVVGITEDGGVVLEDPGRSERFTVAADEQLRAAARGDLTRLGQIAIELESQLRPREIQARIRAGASVEQVAAAAGVPLQKIERFAYPVLLERSRTAEMAQGAHPLRADGPDVRTLGETVAHTFGLRGQEYLEAEWDSWRGEDGRWVVALSWRAGRSDNSAHWIFQPGAHGGTVTALDEHASDLVEGLPMRPLRTVGPVIELGGRPEEEPEAPEPVEPAVVRAAVGAPRRERPMPVAPEPRHDPRPSRPATPEPRRSAETTPVRPAPSAPEPPVAEEPATRPAPAAERPGTSRPELPAERPGTPAAAARAVEKEKETEPEVAPVEEPAVTVPAAAEAPAADAPAVEPSEAPAVDENADDAADAPEAAAADTEDVVVETGSGSSAPPADDAATEPTKDADTADTESDADAGTETDSARPAAARPSRRTKKGKPVMPSWDEVLLGVRGQQR
ncbi:hypothetical protein PSU4_48900 [Pseudonocardia sulfidoxydans NBRC 16205]|uniref:DUF3071 domain-containing protein n=1 Tax=Pseudonocardia sulfidoxydans NBRC 16205 TaxID=1223511 RepID=A0A511DM93_9PSEU|nr:septation protein SepH [Pseudonocardia sulfidoxydans]GEL25936.1 hypothetical protein PSU4_48900 [Pseudonocardia sulfidoxydans NBRC 16205]